MDFEKEYRIEQDRIKHNISLDRMILEKCEKKAPKHNISLGKIYALAGLVAAVIIVTIGVPAAITYGENIYKSYGLVIGNKTVEMEPMEPVYFDIERFKSKEDVQQIKYKDGISYWVAFEDGNLLEDYTGMKLPEDKDFVFRDMMVGFSDKYNIVRCSMTVRQISTGQSALINSQFFANEVKDGDELGDGRDNVKASLYTRSVTVQKHILSGKERMSLWKVLEIRMTLMNIRPYIFAPMAYNIRCQSAEPKNRQNLQ